MRKFRFFLVMLVAAGVLFTTTSCVDDTESSSVTDLRSAKSGQLKALATLANAEAALRAVQGQADLIRAEAEKTQAEAEKARADAYVLYEAALTAQVVAQTATSKAQADANLALATENLRQLKAYNDKLIQGYKDDLEKAAINLQISLLDLQDQLFRAQQYIKSDLRWELNTLILSYSNAISYVNDAKSQIASKTVKLAEEQLDLALYANDSAKFVSDYVATQNATIKSATADIERDTKSLNEWLAFDVKEDVAPKIAAKEEELETVKASLKDLYEAIKPALDERDTAIAVRDRINDLLINYTNLAYGDGYYYYYSDVTSTGVTATWTDYDGVTYRHRGPAVAGDNNYYLSGYSATRGTYIYSQFFNGYSYYWAEIRYYSSPGNEGNYTSKEDFDHQSILVKEDSIRYAKEVKTLTDTLYKLLPLLKTAGENEYAKRVARDAAYDAYQVAYNAYNNASPKTHADTVAVNNAKVAYDGRQALSPHNVIDTTGGASGAWEIAEVLYNDLNIQIRPLNQKIINAKNNLNTATGQLQSYYANLALISQGPREKIQQALDDANEVVAEKSAAYNDALYAYYDASSLTRTLYNDILTLKNLWGVYTNVSGQSSYTSPSEAYIAAEIARLNTAIAESQLAIENAQEKLDNLDVYADNGSQTIAKIISDKKVSIEELEREIEKQKATLEVREQEAAIYKAQIDAILAEIED